MEKSKVYFTNIINAEKLIEIFEVLPVKLEKNVAVKLHSGEVGNQNFLKPNFYKPIIDHVQGTIVECNTAYPGKRNTTEKHWETMRLHGWMDIAKVDIMDEEGQISLPLENGLHLKENLVGSHLLNYNSMLVLSHFKGHPSGGYGGALKNIAIGVASSHGKAVIHGAGNPKKKWSSDHDSFLESMADAAKTIADHFKNQIVYINVMKNMSVDCDCCAKAEDPKINDIGILASLDPVALDQACIDLVYANDDPGKKHLIERIESKNGLHTLEAAEKLNIGNRDYQLIHLD